MTIIIVIRNEHSGVSEHAIYNQEWLWTEEECVEWLGRLSGDYEYVAHYAE